MNPTPHTFSWSIQKSGSKPNQVYPKGKVSFPRFMDFFNHFPWREELQKANLHPDLSFPSISVKHIQSDHYLWVSAHGYPENIEFLIGYIFPKKVRKLSRLFTSRKIQWERIHAVERMEDIPILFKYFFQAEFKSLAKELKKYRLYGDQEIKNIIH